jgi:hypothetical protein
VAVIKTLQRDWCIPYGHTLKTLHTDSGKIFLGHAVQEYLVEQGIKHDCSAPYQHAHNLVEGGCIRILLDRARAILVDSGLPARFAMLAIKYAVHTRNMMRDEDPLREGHRAPARHQRSQALRSAALLPQDEGGAQHGGGPALG